MNNLPTSRTLNRILGVTLGAGLAAAAWSQPQTPADRKHDLGPIDLYGDGSIGAQILLGLPEPEAAKVLPIDRSFADEIPQTADRETLEMSHGENG